MSTFFNLVVNLYPDMEDKDNCMSAVSFFTTAEEMLRAASAILAPYMADIDSSVIYDIKGQSFIIIIDGLCSESGISSLITIDLTAG